MRFIENIDSEKKVFITAFDTINKEFQGTFNVLTGWVGRLELS